MKYFTLLLAVSILCFPHKINAYQAPKEYRAAWRETEYTEFFLKAVEELGGDLLNVEPEDLSEFTDKDFEKLDKKQFYLSMISNLSRFESSHNPLAYYQEENLQYSRGLLQLGKISVNSYGCNIRFERELHDPETNIRCAVRIMNKWIASDKRIVGGVQGKWLGVARYWSPFRNKEILAKIQEEVRRDNL